MATTDKLPKNADLPLDDVEPKAEFQRGGFWNRHPEHAEMLPQFLTGDERDELIEQRVPFNIVRVVAQPNATFQGSITPRWAIVISCEWYDSLRTFTLAMNDARDEMFADMRDWLGNGGEPIRASLQRIRPKSGNEFYAIQAEI